MAKRRSFAAGGVAILLHAAFVTWLVASVRRSEPAADAPVVQLALSSAPVRTGSRSSHDTASIDRSQPSPIRRNSAAATAGAPRPEHTTRPATSPLPPEPDAPAAGAAGGRATGEGVGVAEGDRAALRAIGALVACHSGALATLDPATLDPATRARCEASRLAQARTAPQVDGVPAEKRAYYDAVVAKIEEARALPASVPHVPPLSRSRGLDVTASFGCDIRFGLGAARANRQAGVRLRIPPCPLHLPLSPLTAETRLPARDTLREREDDARAAARLEPPPPEARP